MDINNNFQRDFNYKITKIRMLLENLPRFPTNPQLVEDDSLSTSSSSTVNKIIPKTDVEDFLQQSSRPSMSVHDSFTDPQSSSTSNALFSKKRKKTRKTIDPLRPTKKRSFGVDIGQGINTIKFIKENCCPPSEYQRNRLMNIFEKAVPALRTDKSMEKLYRQLPLSQESLIRTNQSRAEQERKAGNVAMTREQSVLFEGSQESMFRIRYKSYATELPNDYGIDELQSLFVPYHHGEY